MSEKRRYTRLDVKLPVILRHSGRIIPATALNISSGGMYLEVDKSQIINGSPVEVILDLDSVNRDVSMRGQITRVEDMDDQKGIGVQFTNIFSLSHKTVQRYVNENLN